MPIYEFHCNACEQDSELLIRSSSWKGSACPHCGSKKLEKKFSLFSSTAPVQSGGNCGDCSNRGSCESAPKAHSCGGGCCCR